MTALVIVVDADRLGATSNQAAPKGPANADALLLLHIAAQEPLQVLQIPTELGVQLPGEENPGRLAQLWRQPSPLAPALSVAAELQPQGEGVDAFVLIRMLFIGNPSQPAEAVPASRWAIPRALELHQAEQRHLQFPAEGGVGRGCARD